MEAHLKIEHLAPYLPYGLKSYDEEYKEIFEVCSFRQDSEEWLIYDNIDGGVVEYSRDILKPILRPLSDLTKEISYGLSTYAFIDLFEIGDCDGCVFGFEHGNIKTIKALESISKYNSYHDINYLPHAVVNMMYEYHFDVFGLIEQNLAIDINTL